MKNKVLPQLFIIYLRYILGFAFVFASIVKIQGLRFTTESGADNAINTAWHFFETMYQSGLYWKFIGLGQLLAGLLLMTQRYAKLGAILFFPVILNIFIITISYDFRGTPIITGLMLLANILLIIWDWNTIKILFNKTPQFESKNRWELDNIWMYIGIIMFFITVLSRLQLTENSIAIGFPLLLLTGIIGLVLGWIKKKLY